MLVSLLIGKFLFGRRVSIIYLILGMTACIEVFFSFYTFRGGREQAQQLIFLVKATCVYILYYMVCQFGVIDIAKVKALISNYRLCGSLLCVVIASQQIMLAIFYERYIELIILNFWANAIVDQLANLGAAFFLYEMLKSEREEVEMIKHNEPIRMHRALIRGFQRTFGGRAARPGQSASQDPPPFPASKGKPPLGRMKNNVSLMDALNTGTVKVDNNIDRPGYGTSGDKGGSSKALQKYGRMSGKQPMPSVLEKMNQTGHLDAKALKKQTSQSEPKNLEAQNKRMKIMSKFQVTAEFGGMQTGSSGEAGRSSGGAQKISSNTPTSANMRGTMQYYG